MKGKIIYTVPSPTTGGEKAGKPEYEMIFFRVIPDKELSPIFHHSWEFINMLVTLFNLNGRLTSTVKFS